MNRVAFSDAVMENFRVAARDGFRRLYMLAKKGSIEIRVISVGRWKLWALIGNDGRDFVVYALEGRGLGRHAMAALYNRAVVDGAQYIRFHTRSKALVRKVNALYKVLPEGKDPSRCFVCRVKVEENG